MITSDDIKRIAYELRLIMREESDDLLTAKKAAEYLGVTVKTIHKRCSEGKMPCHKKDGLLYFSKAELKEYYLGSAGVRQE